jgi:WD40 repeat protein
MRWLSGHKNDVRAVAFTPDGRLVSGGSDRTVRVWNVASGKCQTTIKAASVVYAVAVSPDGKTLAYAGRYADPVAGGNHIRTWDLTANKAGADYWWEMPRRARWHGPVSHSIWSLAFSADGRYLAAACRRIGGANIPNGGGGHVWACARPQDHSPLPGDDIYAVAFAPTGHRLAVTRMNAVHFLGSPKAETGITYPYTALWSPAVAFVPGRDLAAVASNSFLYFVNPTRQEKGTVVKTGVRTVSALAASPDARIILAGGRPGTVEVYDPETRAKKTTYDFGIGGVHALAFAPDGLTFAVAGDEGLVVCDVPD